jgi:hypothetical protein
MKKFTGLFILTAALLLALPTPRAGAVAPPAGPFFLCVNTTAKPPLPNARVVTSMTACLPFEYLIDLNTNPTNALSVGVVCETESVTGGGGGFNIASPACPAGDIALAGGYSCSDSGGSPIEIDVEVNTFAFGGFNGVTPIGWQTIGFDDSESDGSCRVCATCVPGMCKDQSVSSVCAP